ncbi:MAG: hypothetical protein KGN39_10740 [Betaproteobacteria bacterium]|nr:hypothetical protein [Betaproteobacteria bacterium]
MESLQAKATLSLHEAALLMATAAMSTHDAEVVLARAIERGELEADIKRWATEQWDGRQLPGNFNRLETFIKREALDAWRERCTAA